MLKTHPSTLVLVQSPFSKSFPLQTLSTELQCKNSHWIICLCFSVLFAAIDVLIGRIPLFQSRTLFRFLLNVPLVLSSAIDVLIVRMKNRLLIWVQSVEDWVVLMKNKMSMTKMKLCVDRHFLMSRKILALIWQLINSNI